MIRRVLCLQAAMILFAGSAYAQGKPTKCVAPRLHWELKGQYTIGTDLFQSGIKDGDGKGVYKDGTDGVTAVIELCAVGKDATLDSGNRKITFLFGSPLGPGITPDWDTTGPAFIRIGNIRGLPLDVDPNQEYEFTTWMTTNPPSPKRTDYKFRMVNPGADFHKQYPEDLNQPYVTAKVNVYHCPVKNPAATAGPCTGLTKETFFVYPDPTPTTYSDGTPANYRNVGALIDITRPQDPVIAGQFEVPFLFVISVQ